MLFKRKYPIIQIKYNQFLDPVFFAYSQTNPRWKDHKLPSSEETIAKTEAYKNEWKKYEKDILKAISSVSHLSFGVNFIDVHIVGISVRSLSRPLVIDTTFSPEDFVDMLTHELIHILFSSNNHVAHRRMYSYFKEKYPQETDKTRNHVVLYSIHKYIYLDILKNKNRLERDLIRSKKHTTLEYINAWNIVDSIGYKEIIKLFLSK